MLQGQHKPVRPWPPRGRRQWVVFLGHTLLVAAVAGLLLCAAMLAGCATVTKPSPVEAAAAAGGKAQVSGENAIELHGMLGQYVAPTGKALWQGLGTVLGRWAKADTERTTAEAGMKQTIIDQQKRIGDLEASDPLKTTFRRIAYVCLLGGFLAAVAGMIRFGRTVAWVGGLTLALGVWSLCLALFAKTIAVLTIGAIAAVVIFGLVLLAISVAHQMRSHQMILTDAIAAALGREDKA